MRDPSLCDNRVALCEARIKREFSQNAHHLEPPGIVLANARVD
jgi:hypothetical protein